MVVAAISTPINPKTANQRAPPQNPTRPPLLPSESDNALAPRRPKAREVTSRYLSSSSSSSSSISSTPSSNSRRCHSPLVSRTVNSTATVRQTPPTLVKRSQSVERRRNATPRPNPLCAGAGNGGGTDTPVSQTQKMLFTSTRSLSVSFQGESFSIQVSKAKPAPSPSLRKSTPERRKATTTTPARGAGSGNSDQTENSRTVDQHRWPGKMRNCMSRSVDCADAPTKLGGTGNVVRSLQNLMVDVQASLDGKKTAEVVQERIKAGGSELQPELIPSDNDESVTTSCISSGAQECGGGGGGGGEAQRGSRAIVVPARLWQEANNRLRRQTDPSSPSSRNAANKAMVPPKLLAPKKSVFDSPVSSPRGAINSRGLGSPVRSAVRPASPSKLATPSTWSPSRGVSPSRVRNGVAGSLSIRLNNEPSILCFAVDVPRGKIGENRIVDAHLLRLLYNRLLQWRFVNARVDAALSAQRLNAEISLYDAWVATSKLRESVRAKRTELQLLKQQFKLISILKEQMIYLEDWAILDRVYSSSLSGAIEALKASTLRLPVVGGAKADVLNVKDAICSAVDVMQAMASSICLLLPKVGHVNSLVVEVANLNAKERVLLDECKDLLSMITTMQVRECSLRTHISQLKCLPRSPTMKLTSK